MSKYLFYVTWILVATSCGNAGRKEKEGSLNDQKAKLEKLKVEKDKIEAQITALEKSISEKDTSFIAARPQLVAIEPVKSEVFKHYLDLQGLVSAENVSYVTPSGQPGQIKAIYVREGDRVRKGQLLMKLDNAVAQQNVNAIRQQLISVKAQLDLAKSVYERQKNLWEQNIGTEVQLLQAKTNMEALEGQVKAIQANVATAESQANQANVYSDVNGTVDEVTAKVGETFSGNPQAGGYIKIAGDGRLKVKVTIPESYAGKVSKGSAVKVSFLDTGKEFDGTLSFISKTIDPATRGFNAEINIPAGMDARANQVAKVQILDYSNKNSIAVPLNTMQTDEKGKYVMVAIEQGKDLIAEKKRVVPGLLYGNEIEIKQGLQEGDRVITEGFQGLFEGQKLTTSIN